MTRPEYKIFFGKKEEESAGNCYNNMEVSLHLRADNDGADSSISFTIEDGLGMFDIERKSVTTTLSIKEARHLVDKLKCFIARGEEFVERYTEQ